MNYIIIIRKNSELQGAERFGNCSNCVKGSSEAELYSISFSYDGSSYNTTIHLCKDCMLELSKAMRDTLGHQI